MEIMNLQLSNGLGQGMKATETPESGTVFTKMLSSMILGSNNSLLEMVGNSGTGNIDEACDLLGNENKDKNAEELDALQMLDMLMGNANIVQAQEKEYEVDYNQLTGHVTLSGIEQYNKDSIVSADVVTNNNAAYGEIIGSMNQMMAINDITNEKILISDASDKLLQGNKAQMLSSNEQIQQFSLANESSRGNEKNKMVQNETTKNDDHLVLENSAAKGIREFGVQFKEGKELKGYNMDSSMKEEKVDIIDNKSQVQYGKETFQIIQQETMKELYTVEQGAQKKVDVSQLPEELPKVINARLETMANGKNEKDQLVIQLEPKELGKIIVKLSAEEGIVSVKILAEQHDAKFILENGMSNLKESFQEQGIKYGRLDVEVGGNFHGQSQQQSNQNQWSFQSGQQNWLENGFEHELEASVAKVYDASSLSSGVDYKV